jgi:hypothetical protein
MESHTESAELDRLAARRASMKLAFYVHAAVYAVVNLGLVLLSLSQGRHWALYPSLGWGIGLLVHGAVTWLTLPGGSLRDRMVRREREQIRGRLP